MSKLLKLNGFVSINEVQGYLSKACGEDVSLAEIYQLVLNRDLVISARFDAHEPALLGKYIPFTPEQHSEWLKKRQVPDGWDWVDVDYIYYDEYKEQHYALKPSLTNITGCWDFTMLGSEAKVIDIILFDLEPFFGDIEKGVLVDSFVFLLLALTLILGVYSLSQQLPCL